METRQMTPEKLPKCKWCDEGHSVHDDGCHWIAKSIGKIKVVECKRFAAMKENARLRAAVADMLAALRAFVAWASDDQDTGGLSRLIDDGNAAIAKATA
jgi:hypothetical protein